MLVYAVAVASAIIGIGSLFVFGLFLWSGGFALADAGMRWYPALAWDGVLCLVFFAQHSGMVRRSFREWLSRFVPSYYHGAVYTVASGAALFLLLFWQPSHVNILVLEATAAWLVRGVFFASLGIFAWAIRSLGSLDVFGIEALAARARAQEARAAQLTVRGPYRWVRHPFYFSGIVAIWACPNLSLDRLLFDVLFTLWIVAGAHLEERDLTVQFGDAYRAYQHRVPMLLPWRRPFGAGMVWHA
jgi:methanethiol S-methyltransferase